MSITLGEMSFARSIDDRSESNFDRSVRDVDGIVNVTSDVADSIFQLATLTEEVHSTLSTRQDIGLHACNTP